MMCRSVFFTKFEEGRGSCESVLEHGCGRTNEHLIQTGWGFFCWSVLQLIYLCLDHMFTPPFLQEIQGALHSSLLLHTILGAICEAG